MGKSHALSGLLTGCGLVACVPMAPVGVRLLAVGVTGGAALVNDLDHPSSTVAHSLGPLTRAMARGLSHLSLSVYHATREGADPVDRKSGHRLLTHTVPGCLFGSLGVAAAVWSGPLGTALIVGALVGLLCLSVPLHEMTLEGVAVVASAAGFKGGARGLLLTLVGGALTLGVPAAGWWSASVHPGWSLIYAGAFLVGSLTHMGGDWLTNSGVPLTWPLVIEGRRWKLWKSPHPFDTGGGTEKLVRLLIVALLFLAGGADAGLGGPVVSLLERVVEGGAA